MKKTMFTAVFVYFPTIPGLIDFRVLNGVAAFFHLCYAIGGWLHSAGKQSALKDSKQQQGSGQWRSHIM